MSQPKNDPLLSIVSKKLNEWGVHPHDSTILTGVSGGMDSMVLLHALRSIGYHIAAAHVNYQLRGDDSDLDAALVREWCTLHRIKFFEKVIDTKAFTADHNSNIQSAARQIRYSWWQELMEKYQFTHVATAHHLDDDMESLLINLMRGTGMKGLAGIPPIRDSYIRPMLSVPNQMIANYAALYNIPFRTDLSNESDTYLRNRVRHHLLPLMRDISNKPASTSTFFDQTLTRLKVEWRAWEDAFDKWKNINITIAEHHFKIISDDASIAFALRWLEDKGIPWLLAKDYLEGNHAGKSLQYANLRLSKSNDGFYLEQIKKFETIYIHAPGTYSMNEGTFSIELITSPPELFSTEPLLQYVNKSVLTFPLLIRDTVPGDVFQPFGMEGKHKKLQDFLVNHKLDAFQKSQVKVLTSNEKILWVIGLRLDESARVLPGDQEMYKLEYVKPEV